MRSHVILAVVALAGCHASPAPKPVIATCAQVADHVLALMPKGGEEHAHKVRDVMEHRCRDDHWAAEVTTCIMDEQDLHAGHHCQDRLTAEQRSAFSREVAAIDAPPPPPPRARHASWPAECEAYADAIDQMSRCDKLPMAARDAMRQAFDQGAAAWDSLPPEAMSGLATACQAGADAVHQVMSSACRP